MNPAYASFSVVELVPHLILLMMIFTAGRDMRNKKLNKLVKQGKIKKLIPDFPL